MSALLPKEQRIPKQTAGTMHCRRLPNPPSQQLPLYFSFFSSHLLVSSLFSSHIFVSSLLSSSSCTTPLLLLRQQTVTKTLRRKRLGLVSEITCQSSLTSIQRQKANKLTGLATEDWQIYLSHDVRKFMLMQPRETLFKKRRPTPSLLSSHQYSMWRPRVADS